jgi:hypothetical protein
MMRFTFWDVIKIIRIIRSKKLRWTGNVALVGHRNYKKIVIQEEVKRQLGIPPGPVNNGGTASKNRDLIYWVRDIS